MGELNGDLMFPYRCRMLFATVPAALHANTILLCFLQYCMHHWISCRVASSTAALHGSSQCCGAFHAFRSCRHSLCPSGFLPGFAAESFVLFPKLLSIVSLKPYALFSAVSHSGVSMWSSPLLPSQLHGPLPAPDAAVRNCGAPSVVASLAALYWNGPVFPATHCVCLSLSAQDIHCHHAHGSSWSDCR